MEVYRGDIFYIKKSGVYVGSEQVEGRPAIVVSNNTCNLHSGNVTVVYLTTQEKKSLPTHVEIMCRIKSIALCECVNTVSKDRLGEYVRTCTDSEMAAVEKALMIQFGLNFTQFTDVPAVERMHQQEVDDLRMKLEGAERMLDEEKLRSEEMKKEIESLRNEPKYESNCPSPNCTELNKEVIRLKAKLEMYKEQNEMLFERLVG